MSTRISRFVCVGGATALALIMASCAYPEYSGFDDQPTGDSAPPTEAGPDAPDAAPDVVPEAGPDVAPDADAALDGPVEADAKDAADAADALDAFEAEAEFKCTGHADCAGLGGTPFCDLTSGRCGACDLTNDQCPKGQYCDKATLTCQVGCKTNADCVPPGGPDGGKEDDAATTDDAAPPEDAASVDDAAQDAADEPLEVDGSAPDGEVDSGAVTCSETTHQCVGCSSDDHCPLGTLCQSSVCVDGCTEQHGCPSGWSCCNGGCLNTSDDILHCGGCTTVCPTPANGAPGCAGGVCGIANCAAGFKDCDQNPLTGCEADTNASLDHCGGCQQPCNPNHGTGKCTAGVCSMGVCDTGWADCDTDLATGCEVNLVVDQANCGVCGTVCQVTSHASPACIGATCDIGACDPGYGDCDSEVSTGCEANIKTNPLNCGGCGVVCSLLNANPKCVDGLCEVASCNAPFANCDKNAVNGCETNTQTDSSHCGFCDNGCTFTNALGSCVNSGCQMGACNAGFADCDSSTTTGCEINTKLDVLNCGGCDNICQVANGTPECANSSCKIGGCTLPWDDCNKSYGDGCEINTLNNALHCGACGTVCAFPNAASSCVNGTCTLGTCNQGYADCDGIAANGCEVSTTNDPLNCGACKKACNSDHGTPGCAGGVCSIACSSGFADCNTSALDGCETAITNSVTDCGACKNACTVAHGTPSCNGTTCAVGSCAVGWGDCDDQYGNGCETQLNSNANCAACGTPCAPANATGDCSSGACAVATCNAGFLNCDGNAANGCEINSLTDVLHCGSCTKVCPDNQGEPKCTNGTCGYSNCNPGTADCDSNAATCETNTTNDPNNCGACGNVCTAANGTAACVASKCVVTTCNAGFANCNNTYGDGCEVNLKTNANCGSCGSVCSRPDAVTSCSSGTCQLTGCNSGFANCDNDPLNGCEINTNTSAANCGGCGLPCSTNNGNPSCNSGTCSIVCTTGFGNCDTNVANGCEAEFASNTNACGGCGNVCNSTNGSPTCTGGSCGISCNSGFGNCDNNASNGCETATSANLSHCGACNHACNSTNGSATCNNSTCGIICTPGFGNCDNNVDNGCEAVFASDPLHCGSCSGLCNLPNAVEGCSGSACTIASCNPNWGNCDGTVSNGCETPTASDVANCGSCNNVCGSANGTRSCDAGVCKIACSVGYGNCDNVNANGCETSTNTDVNHCGGCGTVCPAIPNGTAGCLVGVCGVASCNAGYHLDNGQCLSDDEICTGGIDEDGDGRLDCFDSDCDTNPACNGTCRDAETISCDSFVTGKSTGGAGSTQHIAPPAYGCTSTSYPGPERAFKFTGSAGQDVVAEIYGLGGNLAVFAVNPATGAQCNAMTSCLTYGDQLTTSNAEALAFTAAAGKDYYLVVDGAAAANFSMTVQCIPSGGCLPSRAIQSGQTIAATNVAGSAGNITTNILHHAPFSGNGWTGPEAAFVFTPTATGTYVVTIDGTNGGNAMDCDADLFVKQASLGCGQETLAYSATTGRKPELISFSGVANTTYFIVIDGFTDNGVGCETDFILSITGP